MRRGETESRGATAAKGMGSAPDDTGTDTRHSTRRLAMPLILRELTMCDVRPRYAALNARCCCALRVAS